MLDSEPLSWTEVRVTFPWLLERSIWKLPAHSLEQEVERTAATSSSDLR